MSKTIKSRNLIGRSRRFLHRLRLNFYYAFHWHKPLLVLRLVHNMLLVVFFRKRLLRYVDFALDFTCNQHCQHCFASSYDHQKTKGRHAITQTDYKRIVSEAMGLGAVSFSIQGGEPFAVMKDTLNVLGAIPVNRCLVSIKSNGTLITRERADEMKKAGVDIVTVSIDSADAVEHDEFRGMKGALVRTYQGVEHCLAVGLRVMIACTLSHQNVRTKGITDLIEYTREKGLILFFIKAAPSGNWSGNESVLLQPEDQAWIEEILREHLHCRTDFEANYWDNGCGALQEILYISQYGDVMSCPFIQVSFGNALKTPLRTIWEEGLKYPYFSSHAKLCQIADEGPFLTQYLKATKDRNEMPISIEEFHRQAENK